MSNPNRFLAHIGGREIATVTMAALLVPTAVACGTKDFDTEVRNTAIGLSCASGDNILVVGPFVPGEGIPDTLFVTNEQAVEPQMVGEGTELKDDAGDFMFLAACETGPLAVSLWGTEAVVSPDAFAARPGVDAIIEVETEDKLGTREYDGGVDRYASTQHVTATQEGGDSVAYITLDDADKINKSSIHTPDGQERELPKP